MLVHSRRGCGEMQKSFIGEKYSGGLWIWHATHTSEVLEAAGIVAQGKMMIMMYSEDDEESFAKSLKTPHLSEVRTADVHLNKRNCIPVTDDINWSSW